MGSCVFHDTDASLRERRLFEIVERAYGQKELVLVYVPTPQRAAAVDRILWINKQEAFIPHEIVPSGETGVSVPVAIVTAEEDPIGAEVLVADGHCSIEFAARFRTIHEFVDKSSDALREACRARFRAYRALQFSVEYSK